MKTKQHRFYERMTPAERNARFGEIREAAHTLQGGERWSSVSYLLKRGDHDFYREVCVPYLLGLFKGDDTARGLMYSDAMFVEADLELPLMPLVTHMIHMRGGGYMGSKRMERLVSSHNLQSVRLIDLSSTNLTDRLLAQLVDSDLFSQLQVFIAERNPITDKSAVMLANSPAVANLTKLGIDFMPFRRHITRKGYKALHDSPYLQEQVRQGFGKYSLT